MIGALYNGIAGLTSEQKALDNESNNIANVNTTGYKSSRISFSDLCYCSDVGKGAVANDPTKVYTQGTVKQTGNNYDFAINGDGFFEVQDSTKIPPATYYTRAGDFQRSASGYLQNAQGLNVLGVNSVVTGDNITSDYTKFIGSAVFDSNTETKSINTYTTDISDSVKGSGTSGDNLKSAADTLKDYEQIAKSYQDALIINSQNPTDGIPASKESDKISFGTTPKNGKYDLSIRVNGELYIQQFDTSVENTLNKLSDQLSSIKGVTSSVDTTTGELTVSSIISGDNLTVTEPKLNDDRVGIENISKGSGSGEALVNALYSDLKNIVEVNGGKVATNTSTITKASTGKPLNSDPIQLDLAALGMNQNRLGDIELDYDNGIVYMTSGEAKYAVAQLTTVNFTSQSGLDPMGDNIYAATKESGDSFYIQGKSSVANKSLELSNADLSENLVNLMVYQRGYEANSKSVTTADEFLQTAIQMKK